MQVLFLSKKEKMYANKNNEMNHPSFIVYPYYQGPNQKETPEHRASVDFMNSLHARGFNPMIDSRGQPSMHFVNTHNGLLHLYGGEIILVNEYEGQKIMAIQFYSPPLNEEELNVVKRYFSDELKYIPLKFNKLLKRGAFDPPGIVQCKAKPMFDDAIWKAPEMTREKLAAALMNDNLLPRASLFPSK